VRAFLAQNCLSCHSAGARNGGLQLDDKDLGLIRQNVGVWEKVLRKLRAGLEPPVFRGSAKVDSATVKSVVSWLETELDRNAQPYLRAPGLHRLNRTEYGNAIRDLLGLEINPASLLPSDDSVRGFDNIASALGMSAAHAEAVVAAAGKISAQAIASAEAGRLIFLCRPTGAADEETCARRIITNLANRAFRNPAASEDVDALMVEYRGARSGASFDKGIESALQRILGDRNFIYRIEAEPANLAAGQSYPISDFELASRLSYFLWSRGPDDRLLDLAGRGQLQSEAVLETEVRRMLQDSRSEALAINFAGQWLNFRGLAGLGSVDEALRQSMRREGELFFDSIVREDRNVVDLLTADYTFVNDRLARHYGMPNITGAQFRRVTLGSQFDVRRGLLGKASILTTTSRLDRNSIVDRGAWVMRTILGVPPPDPPPNVPAFAPRVAVAEPPLRQKMLAHRVRTDCVSCHGMFDPIGFALENFDRTGLWREQDEGQPVDASGEFFDGTKMNGPADLRNALLQYSDQFVQNFIERLFTYATGRGAEVQDMPTIRLIAREAVLDRNRFSTIVVGIVKSKPFQTNAKE